MSNAESPGSTKRPGKSLMGAGFRGATCIALGFALSSALDGGRPPGPPHTPTARVYFSPKDNCTQAIVASIRDAESEILVQAYSFTCPEIAEALVKVHQNKPHLTIAVLVDNEQNRTYGKQARSVSQAGVTVRLGSPDQMAHNKVIIIDRRTVVTGSFNFSIRAKSSAENLLILEDPRLAAKYRENWEQHWALSVPLQDSREKPPTELISPAVAAAREGKVCTVRMRVAQVVLADGYVFIHSRGYRVPGDFKFWVCPEAAPEAFAGRPEAFRQALAILTGQTVFVTGRVSRYENSLQIKVNDPRQTRQLLDSVNWR